VLQVKTGSFSIGTGAAGTTVAVSGLGFAPKAVVLYMTGPANTTNSDNTGAATVCVGFFTASEQGFVANRTNDATANSQTGRMMRTDSCLQRINYNAVAPTDGGRPTGNRSTRTVSPCTSARNSERTSASITKLTVERT